MKRGLDFFHAVLTRNLHAVDILRKQAFVDSYKSGDFRHVELRKLMEQGRNLIVMIRLQVFNEKYNSY